MGDEYLVWEEKENFRGFRDFRGFCEIDLAVRYRIYRILPQFVIRNMNFYIITISLVN